MSAPAQVSAPQVRAGGFPFSAVLGMDDLRLALLLNAVSPQIGGVLVRGEKGTAKSTAVRAMTALLPPVHVVTGCRFACDPAQPDPQCPDGPHGSAAGEVRPVRLVELPVGAAEDRVAGSLDLERALAHGVTAFEPGLLAAAHRGLLYVDEVNLLHDHLVDLLLDAAAMGRAHVEREGVSVSHAARFLLVGTMNPEEGELRPQLLDRFGLTVEVQASRDPAVRMQVVRRRLAADADPAGFARDWADADAALAAQVAAAQARLPGVNLSDAALAQIAQVCADFDVDGMRADIVMARTALAHAAWNSRGTVLSEDVAVAARLALPHRRRRTPFDEPGLDEQALQDSLEKARQDHPETPPESEPKPDGPDDDGPEDDGPGDGGGGPGGGSPRDGGPGNGDAGQAPEASQAESSQPGEKANGQRAGGEHPPVQVSEPAGRARLLTVKGIGPGVPGRRSQARTGSGRTTAAMPQGRGGSGIALPATIRAAAVHQRSRGRTEGSLKLRRCDVRQPVRQGREGNLVLFLVDASGSMGARQRMQAVKGAVLSLLTDAYQRRDTVALIAFRASGAQTLLPATASVEAAVARLQELPTGGRTPVAEGLLAAGELLRLQRLRDPNRRPLLVVITDGRATFGQSPVPRSLQAASWLGSTGVDSVVVDCEAGGVRLGLAAQLATALGAQYLPLADVTTQSLIRSVTQPGQRQPRGKVA